jgi:hypothetical protein
MSRRARKFGKSAHSFVRIEHRMLLHPAFGKLSSNACKALLFLASQYRGENNGDLTIAWRIAKDKGFRSNGSLRVSTLELVTAGFVIRTRQGGRNQCSLFALSWFPINHCDGKLDVPATSIASNEWMWNDRTCEPSVVQ